MASYDDLVARIRRYWDQGRWSAALTSIRRCLDQYHRHPCEINVFMILRYVHPFEQETDVVSASDDYLLALMYNCGVGGVRCNPELSRKYYERAADRGYPLALLQRGHMLYSADRVKSFQCFFAAAQQGCPDAVTMLARCFRDGHGCNQDITQAALWYARGDVFDGYFLGELLRNNPQECIPYGIWRTDRIYQKLLPTDMRQAIFTWLLVAKRRRVARYVALLVCSFIVTRPGPGQRVKGTK